MQSSEHSDFTTAEHCTRKNPFKEAVVLVPRTVQTVVSFNALSQHVGEESKNTIHHRRTAVAQWLRCCATNRKVAGSIPAGVNGFFIDIKSFLSHYGPGVESTSNSNEYQEYFLVVKPAGA